MKKILFVHNKLVCGGAEKALYDLLYLLNKDKYEVTLFVLNDGGEWEQRFRDVGIKVINAYSNQIKGHKIRNFILRKRINNSRRKYCKDLLKIAVKKEYDLYVAYNIFDKSKDIFKGLKGKKIRYVHGDIQTNEYLKNTFLKDQRNFVLYDKFICVSECAKISFDKTFTTKNKTIKIFNPIDNKSILELSHEKIKEDFLSNYICAIGRLSFEKGFERLIRIFCKLVNSGIKQKLIIVGDGYEKENLVKLIRDFQMENSIYILGYKSNPYPYIKNSLFTVIPSYTEGLPVVAFESIVLSVPVVSSFPSIKEIFGNETCGVVTENDDISLKYGLQKMLTDKSFYELACEGVKKRSVDFTSEKMISEVERIFDEVINED